MLDRQKSRDIYGELINGRAINKQIMGKDGRLEPNPLFEELFSQYDSEYAPMYDNLGFELVLRDGYAFMRSSSDNDDQLNDVALKIHALLTVLARGVQELGYTFDLLTTHDAGISETLLSQLETEDKLEILQACGIKDGFVKAIQNTLIRRNIAYMNARGHLVLTAAGKGFFNAVFGKDHPSISPPSNIDV